VNEEEIVISELAPKEEFEDSPKRGKTKKDFAETSNAVLKKSMNIDDKIEAMQQEMSQI